MSSSILRRVWQRFLKPTYFAGKDLQGNKYYEYPNANDGRPRRIVQYKRNDDMWAYVASGKRLPVQWNAWLTHTRPDPPSLKELQADLARQHRVRMNAAILEARDGEERDRMARLAPPSHLKIPQTRLENEQDPKQSEPPSVDVRSESPPTRDPWAEAKRGSDEPQSWTPVVRHR